MLLLLLPLLLLLKKKPKQTVLKQVLLYKCRGSHACVHMQADQLLPAY
jgi:hypothetical protein